MDEDGDAKRKRGSARKNYAQAPTPPHEKEGAMGATLLLRASQRRKSETVIAKSKLAQS